MNKGLIAEELKVKYINAIIHGVQNSLKELSSAFGDIIAKDLYIRDKMITHHPVVIEMKFLGSLEGKIFLSMDLQTAINMADCFLMTEGSFATGFNEMAQSAITEVANMIVGQSMMFLTEAGDQIDFMPPKLFYGRKVKTNTSSCPVAFTVPLETSSGMLELDVAIDVKEEEEVIK